MITPIQNVYFGKIGEYYTVRGIITIIEPKRIRAKEGDKEGLIRTKFRIKDDTGSIDVVVFHASTPGNFFLEEEVQVYGKFQQVPPKPPYDKPYTSLLVKIGDFLHASDVKEEGGSLPSLGVPSSNPDLIGKAPEILFVDEYYLPTPRIGVLLVELHSLLGKYIEEMKKK